MKLSEKLALFSGLNKEPRQERVLHPAIREAPLAREYLVAAEEGGGAVSLAEIASLPERYWQSLFRAILPRGEHRGGLQSLLFFDLETTGLGGAGSYAFMAGTLCLTREGFSIKQFFLPHPAFEADYLDEIAHHFSGYGALVSYNGIRFDVPILKTRAVMQRKEFHMPGAHYDLLYAARAFWSERYENCRLKTLEQTVCSYRRPAGDIDGMLIPDYYFQWLHEADAARLEPVFTHNRADLIALLHLAAHIAVIAGDADAKKTIRGNWTRPGTPALVWLAGRALAASDETRACALLRKAAHGAGADDTQNSMGEESRRNARLRAALLYTRLLRRNGEAKEAADFLTTLHSEGIASAASLIALAWLYERALDNADEALRLYTECLKMLELRDESVSARLRRHLKTRSERALLRVQRNRSLKYN